MDVITGPGINKIRDLSKIAEVQHLHSCTATRLTTQLTAPRQNRTRDTSHVCPCQRNGTLKPLGHSAPLSR